MSSSRALPRPSSLPRSRFLDVTQRSPKTLRERCVTSKKTAAKETTVPPTYT